MTAVRDLGTEDRRGGRGSGAAGPAARPAVHVGRPAAGRVRPGRVRPWDGCGRSWPRRPGHPRAPGVLRLGHYRRGRARADRGDRGAAARGGRRPGRAAVRHRVQGRARAGRREDRLRAAIRGDPARTGPAGRRSRRSPASGCSTAAACGRGRPSTRDRSASSAGLRDIRIGDPIGARREDRPSTSRRRRWRRSSSRSAPGTGAAAGRTDPARRAGPADRPAPGRPAPGGPVSLYGEVQKEVLAGHPRRRVRPGPSRSGRPRPSASSGRPARAGRTS